MGPIVAEVVEVEEPIPDLDEKLVKPDRALVDSVEFVLDRIGRSEPLGETVPRAVAIGELVQVRIRPAHRGLQDIVQCVQR